MLFGRVKFRLRLVPFVFSGTTALRSRLGPISMKPKIHYTLYIWLQVVQNNIIDPTHQSYANMFGFRRLFSVSGPHSILYEAITMHSELPI